MKTTKHIISKAKKKRNGVLTQMVVYKTQVSKGKLSSRTVHEAIR